MPSQKGDFEAAVREHELAKYLQLFCTNTPTGGYSHIRHTSSPFSWVLPELSTLRDAHVLVTHVELLRLRLGVEGAFVVLVDGDTPYFLAGTPPPDGDGTHYTSSASSDWLGSSEADVQQWLRIFHDTMKLNRSSPDDLLLTIPSLKEDDRSRKISTVGHTPNLSFFAGTPMISKQGAAVGAVFVVDTTRSEPFSAKHVSIITDTAGTCIDQLEFACESRHQERWRRMNKQLSRFVNARVVRAEEIGEPTPLAKNNQQQRREDEVEDLRRLARRHHRDPSKVENVELSETTYNEGPENQRLARAEDTRNETMVEDDGQHKAKELVDQRNGGHNKPGMKGKGGESTYRKIFGRAAECLREALQVDGVLFTNGVLGHHGAVQVVRELDDHLNEELESQTTAIQDRVDDKPTSEKGGPQKLHSGPQGHSDEGGSRTRTYTSAEYMRGIHVERPAEILGISTSDQGEEPETSQIGPAALGLPHIDECHVLMLMETYPDGVVWYVHGATSTFYRVEDDTLVKVDALEDTRGFKGFITNFEGVCQVIFQPLTDPVTLKRLAGCFAWTTQPFPVFTDTTDLPTLRGFLHILESESSRLDASMAVKQKEAFVSSVSHELRTPLHGILGSVELLADTRLDQYQTSLVDTIKTSGSTLNETLVSVLSYAKINQFERQQNKYRDRGPPDRNWSLKNKDHFHPGPDTDYQDLYLCTNVAMLFEEIAGVLEGCRTHDKSMNPSGPVTVTLEIDYSDNWNFLTEPGALRRIAINIVGNALKYTPEGSVVISLTASEMTSVETAEIPLEDDMTKKKLVTFSVKDTGKGMSNEFMDHHLFIPFTQEDTTSSQGVGLGMSIVKSLVTLLAGEITVQSEQGKGTEVTVMMPMRLYDSDLGETENPARELQECIAQVRGQHLSAVLFGFAPTVRRSLERYLREWFHFEILARTEDAEPDLVLVNEGNDEAASEVERTAHQYGRKGVLLSVAMERDRLAKPMREVPGYTYCQRIPPPIGPSNLGRAFQACITNLKDLREGGAGHINHPENDAANHNQPGTTPKDKSNRSHPTSFPPNSKNDKPDTHPSNIRVLVAEDNAINRKILGAFLKQYGCQSVQFAENGALAVKAVEEQEGSERFDIIFMDLSMPVMNGFKATREIRRLEHENSLTPAHIVALTGLASDRDEDEAREAGVDRFITKPVPFEKLKKVMMEREGKRDK